MSSYYLVAFMSTMLSSLSQVLLKKSSSEKKKNIIFEYLNLKVIAAYGITLTCMLMMIYAFKGIDYKYGAVIESLSGFFIMVFSAVFFKEKITGKRIIGNTLIILGVTIFSINL